MAHSLTTTPATATLPPISIKSKTITSHVPSLRSQGARACHQDSKPVCDTCTVNRRTITLGLAGALLGLNAGSRTANAARRPSPPPPEEKKDPNVSGLQAKVQASKKRKEAMKESIAKLREKGRPVNE